MKAEQSKNYKITIGMRFDNCIVVGFDYRFENHNGQKKRKMVAVCKCDCEAEFTALQYRLRNGSTTSCGPCKKKLNGRLKTINLIGQRFSRLVVIEQLESTERGQSRWLCECDCGETVKTTGKLLRTEQTKSCGCYSRDRASDRRNKLEGQKFGLLTVIDYLGDAKYSCRCKCGAQVVKPSQGLVEKSVVYSCGSPICCADPNYVGPILSLDIARNNGLTHYSDGKKCSRGHISSKLVSTMGCSLCHRESGKNYRTANAEKVKDYHKQYNKLPKAKNRRNNQLKKRRDTDFVYRYSELVRNRLRKVLKSISVKKPQQNSRSRRIYDDIMQVVMRQSLSMSEINSGFYELDHIIPLATYPWSQSETANALIEMEANSPDNLQFLNAAEHKKKTLADAKKYGWNFNRRIYFDHSEILLKQIEGGKPLPIYFAGKERQILSELLEARSNGNWPV